MTDHRPVERALAFDVEHAGIRIDAQLIKLGRMRVKRRDRRAFEQALRSIDVEILKLNDTLSVHGLASTKLRLFDLDHPERP